MDLRSLWLLSILDWVGQVEGAIVVAGYGNSFGARRDIYDETGIYARWYFEQRLNEECSRARRKGGSVALICLSVDDRTALTAGYTLWRHVRDYDLIGRAARTRFVVAVLDAAPEHLEGIAARLRELVDLGSDAAIVQFPEDGDDAQQLINNATARVLGAKAG
jgi:GGDEF domain-containing protein